MPPSVLNPEHLVSLIDDLREVLGFNVTTNQYIAAQDLIVKLAAHGALPADPRELDVWLGPVLCASPEEQAHFYPYYRQWVAERLQLTTTAAKVTAVASTTAEKELPAAAQTFRARLANWLSRWRGTSWKVWSGAAVVLLGLAVGSVAAVEVLLPEPSLPPMSFISGQVVGENGEPVGPSAVSFSGETLTTPTSGEVSLVTDAGGEIYLVVDAQETSAAGPLKMSVKHPGYQPLETTIPSGAGQTRVKINLRALPQPTPPTQSADQPQPSPSTETTVRPPVAAVTYIATPPPPPPPTPEQTTRTVYQNNFPLILLVVGLLPFLVWGAWLLWRYGRRRRLRLKKEEAARQWGLDQLLVHGASDQLFRGQAFRRLAQEMRRHLQLGSLDIDPQPTVHATIRQGGWFTPVYGRRREQPEYLALIDRASFRDQQARLEDEILTRLVKDSILIERLYFQGDPLVCRRADKKSTSVALQDLSVEYPNHHLLIFSDGASLIDPRTGHAQSWVETLTQWPRRALLTPEPPPQWGYREWMLSEQGFVVAPANREGLRAMIETINTGAPPKLGRQRAPQPFPGLLLERPRHWLENLEPERMELNRLCFQLRRYLGDEGYHLLAACAVYPALSWDLTVYLGYKLEAPRAVATPDGSGGDGRDESATLEELLPLLVRLPWFRQGTMPDWLRLRLLSALPPEHETCVRGAIRELLLTALNPRQQDLFPLQYARRDPAPDEPDKTAETQTFRSRLYARLRAWRRKRLFWNLMDSEPRHSQLRDHVFLDFMSRRDSRDQSLTIKVPDALRRILTPPARLFQRLRNFLFPEGIANMGWRLKPTFAAAVLASFICLTAASALLPTETDTASVDLGDFCWYCAPTIQREEAIPTPTTEPDGRATPRRSPVTPRDPDVINDTIPPPPPPVIYLQLDIYASDRSRLNELVTVTLQHKTRPELTRTINNVDAAKTALLPLGIAGQYDLTVTAGETNRSESKVIDVNPVSVTSPFPVEFLTQIPNPTPEELRRRNQGTIDIRLIDTETSNPIEGQVEIYLRPGGLINSTKIDAKGSNIRVFSGNLEILASSRGYVAQRVETKVDPKQTQSMSIPLSRFRPDSASPTPPPTPVVTPEATPERTFVTLPMIESVQITLHTQNNAKDAEDWVSLTILAGGSEIGSTGRVGQGETWGKGRSRQMGIKLKPAVSLEQCRNLTLVIEKGLAQTRGASNNELRRSWPTFFPSQLVTFEKASFLDDPRRGQSSHQWDVQVEVAGMLTSGRQLTILSRSQTYKLGEENAPSVKIPLSCSQSEVRPDTAFPTGP